MPKLPLQHRDEIQRLALAKAEYARGLKDREFNRSRGGFATAAFGIGAGAMMLLNSISRNNFYIGKNMSQRKRAEQRERELGIRIDNHGGVWIGDERFDPLSTESYE